MCRTDIGSVFPATFRPTIHSDLAASAVCSCWSGFHGWSPRIDPIANGSCCSCRGSTTEHLAAVLNHTHYLVWLLLLLHYWAPLQALVGIYHWNTTPWFERGPPASTVASAAASDQPTCPVTTDLDTHTLLQTVAGFWLG